MVSKELLEMVIASTRADHKDFMLSSLCFYNGDINFKFATPYFPLLFAQPFLICDVRLGYRFSDNNQLR